MANLYESRRYLGEYLLFHYGTPNALCAYPFAPQQAFNFHRRIVRELVPPHCKGRVLDVGCAVGRLSFELSRQFDEVVGIDNSKSFIAAANRMCRRKRIELSIVEEGERTVPRSVVLPKRVRSRRVRFLVGDAQRLPERLGTFDAVVAANLIDRLPDPRRFLRLLPRLVVPGGLLVLTSPYTWLEQYTPKRNWLGGGKTSTFAGLKRILGPDFKLVRRRNLPFLIREHGRKYQLVVAEGTTWIRRENSR